MKRQIRRGVFETNSSSTHSLTICTKEEYDKWERGEVLFSRWHDKFVELENVDLTDEDIDEIVNEYNKKKQKYWKNWEELSNEEKEELYSAKLKEKIEYKKDCDELVTCEEYFDDEYLEVFEEHYTTPNGEKIVVFGKYGYDG